MSSAQSLPQGWAVSNLEQLTHSVGGGTPSTTDESFWQAGTIPWVSPKDMKSFRVSQTIDRVTDKALTRLTLVPANSVLVVVRSGILARTLPVAVNSLPVVLNQDMRAFVPAPGVNASYLAWQLVARTNDVLASCTKDGTTVASIKAAQLAGFPLRLAPHAEQVRIVDAVEELCADLDAAVAELQAAQRKLTLYRQSLLKSAVEGTLTAEWRQRNPPNETGAQLLCRIADDRAGPELSANDLPASWAATTVRAVGDVQLGRQRAPKYHEGDNMLPYLRVANVFEERIDTGDVMTMHFSADDEARYLLEPGDILLNEGQSSELVGRPAVFNGELERVCFTNTLVRFRATPGVEGQYALLVFLHYLHSGAFRALAPITTNIAHLGVNRFAAMRFPLPPTCEQQEIVRRFADLRLAINDQSTAINRALAMATAQRQNILRAAFSGQLVPQDPNDEPASVLFDRIRARRAAAGSPALARRGRKAKVAA